MFILSTSTLFQNSKICFCHKNVNFHKNINFHKKKKLNHENKIIKVTKQKVKSYKEKLKLKDKNKKAKINSYSDRTAWDPTPGSIVKKLGVRQKNNPGA